jgi:transposase
MSKRQRSETRGGKGEVERIELDMGELQGIVARAGKVLSEDERVKLKGAVETLQFLTRELEKKGASIGRLRRMLFGASTESTRKVVEELLKQADASDEEAGSSSVEDAAKRGGASGKKQEQGAAEEKKKKGHGRNGAEAYTGAQKVTVRHGSLKPGDPCPKCPNGKVYETGVPGKIVRITGRPPVDATVYELQKLRCNLCGEIFTAEAPADAQEQKYDAKTASMIALLKYGSGLPFNRLEGLQGHLGIPLPASTQWEIVAPFGDEIRPIHEELIRQGAQGKVVYHDDTDMTVLEFLKKRKAAAVADEEEEEVDAKRTGVFTSGIVSECEGHRVAMYFTGRKHAGENLADVLKRRVAELPVPIQMCDPLSRNMPKELNTILAKCLAHGRRKFVDIARSFPAACVYILRILKKVYANDGMAREQNMSDQERLRYHQAKSGPLMKELEDWFAEQIEGRKVEPNSTLGEAIIYAQRHWHEMTLFLRVPGAPLDNNLVERALKKSILHRKNSYFYKTRKGARTGDTFMSLIHTCELNGVNPFEYLTELHKHTAEASATPAAWMPWNYREALKMSDANARG